MLEASSWTSHERAEAATAPAAHMRVFWVILQDSFSTKKYDNAFGQQRKPDDGGRGGGDGRGGGGGWGKDGGAAGACLQGF